MESELCVPAGKTPLRLEHAQRTRIAGHMSERLDRLFKSLESAAKKVDQDAALSPDEAEALFLLRELTKPDVARWGSPCGMSFFT